MDELGVGSLVVAHFIKPKEKIWGLIRRLDGLGLVIRGIDLNSFEDWLRQEKAGHESLISPSTIFFPVHRIERIYLDESTPMAASFSDRFASACGRNVRSALLPIEPDGPVS